MTARQFYITFIIMVVSTKMQRFPVLLFSEFGKDGYLMIFGYALINILGILLAFFIYKYVNQKAKTENRIFVFIKKFIMFVTSVYFLIQALLLFEHVQNIFADTLFDKFSWSIFSLLFLFAIFFLAKTGIKNIALNFELFSTLIISALIIISLLGATQSDYSVVLPLQTIDFKTIAYSCTKFNVWFGDFFVILYLLFHTNKPKLSKTILFYSLSICFVIFLVLTFNGVYGEYSKIQSGLISSITEQSMLGLNIGRIDWFLILVAEIGTILSASVCIYFSNKTMQFVFNKVKPIYVSIFIAIIFYIMNVFVLLDKFVVKEFFFGIGADLSLWLKILTLAVFLILSLKNFLKRRNIKEMDNGKIF